MTSNAKSTDIKLSKILHYGAQITLSLADETAGKGFIFGDGFITKTITYKKESAFEMEDFTGSIFKIVQPFVYTAQKLLEQEIYYQLEEEKPKLGSYIQDLMNEADIELQQNLDQLERMKKKPIVFGTPVQLLHVKSRKFLSFRLAANQSASPSSSDQYNFKLVEHSSEDTLFRIMPSYKFQNEKDRYVKFEDHVTLVSGSEIFSRASYLYVETTKSKNTSKEANFGMMMDRANEDPILMSFDKSSKLKIFLYSEAIDNADSVVSFGDIVWLQHIERSNYLIYDNKKDMMPLFRRGELPTDYKPYQYGIYFLPVDPSVGRDSNGMWKIESVNKFKAEQFTWDSNFRLRHIGTGYYITLKKHEDAEIASVTLERKATLNSVFQFRRIEFQEDEEYQSDKGGLITSDDFLRLRHVGTGLWISVNDLAASVNEIDNHHFHDTSSLLVTVPVITDKYKQDDVFKLVKAKDAEIWETYILTGCYPILKRANLLLQALYSTRDSAGFFKTLEWPFEYGLTLIKDSLISMINFLHDQNSDTLNFNTLLKVNPARQKMLKEQGFINVLSNILESLFPNKEALGLLKILHDEHPRKEIKEKNTFITRQTIWQEFQTTYMIENIQGTAENPLKQRNQAKTVSYLEQIGCLIYELIKYICKDNRENEAECFKYIEIYKKQAGHGLGVTNCIISIFSHNEMLLYSLYSNQNFSAAGVVHEEPLTPVKTPKTKAPLELNEDSSLICFFINRLKSASPKFHLDVLKFLSAACKFEEQGITVNQTLINTMLFEDPMLKSIAFLQLACKDDKIYFQIPESEKSKMKENEICLDDATRSAGRFDKYITYLTEQLELYSNLCYGRQYVCRESILPILPMQTLMQNIWKTELPKQVRAALVMVLSSVYVDSNPRSELIVPQMTRALATARFQPMEISRGPSLQKKKTFLGGFGGGGSTIELTDSSILDEPRIINDDYEIDVTETKGENEMIMKLKTDIIAYLAEKVFTDHKKQGQIGGFSPKYIEFDTFLHNLILVAKKMAVFGLYSSTGFANLNQGQSKEGGGTFLGFKLGGKSQAKSELAQLVNVLFPILLIDLEEPAEDLKFSKKATLDESLKNSKSRSVKVELEESKIKEKLKKVADNINDDIIGIEVRKEILSVIHFAMDLRLNYLITNALHYFSKKVLPLEYSPDLDNGLIRIVDRGGYLPNIMKSQAAEETNEKPDLIKDEVRFNEDLDRMTDTYSLKHLLQLFMRSKDFGLETQILSIIFQSFSQRSTLVKSLREVNVVFSEKEIGIFEYCAAKIRELSFQVDQSEIWLLGPKKNEKVIDSVNETLQNLVNGFFSSTRVDKATNKLVDYPEQLSDNLISHTRQQLMHSIELHKVLMNLVKDGTHILESFTGDSRKVSDLNAKTIAVFKNCYLLLALMCRNDYKKAKKSLAKFISIFSMHLPLHQVGQSELICEIYKESDFTTTVSGSLTSTFLENILYKGRNPSYLNFFETILQETNLELLQDNISRILSILNDTDRRYKFLYMEYSEKRKQYEFSLSLNNRREGDFPFTYHKKILEILIIMLEKSINPVLIKLIVQKLIPLNAILRVLSKKDCFSPEDEKKGNKGKAYLYSMLKKPLTKFFNKFWLDNDKFNPHFTKNKQLLKFIENETHKLAQVQPKLLSEILARKKALQVKARADFNNSMNNELYMVERTEENMFEEVQMNELPSAKYRIVVDTSEIAKFAYDYLCYTLAYLLPMMVRLNAIFNSPENENHAGKKMDQECLQGYAESFRVNFFKLHKLFMQAYHFKNNVDEFLDSFLIDEDNLKQADEHEDIGDITVFEIEESQNVSSNFSKKFQASTLSHSDAMRLDSLIMNHTFIDEKDDEGKQKIWKSFVLNMSISESVRKLIVQERKALLKTLMSIDSMEFENNKSQLITFEKFVRKIILHIQTCTENIRDFDSHKESLNGSIMLLTDILNACESEAELVQMQSLLYRCQAVRIACNVFLKTEIPGETQKLMIHFCTKILDGGNTEVQMGFYSIFKSDINSENFFYTMYNLLSSEIARNGKKISSTQKAENCIHSLEYVDQQSQFKLSMILRLMQLFAENHNSDLQAYFREQTNSKNNYNMISLMVKLAETLATNLTEEKYLILLQCMDTLTEFIQGPCLENQVALANNRYIEMASNVLQVSVKEKDTLRKSKETSSDIRTSKKSGRSLWLYDKGDQSLATTVEEAVTRYYADISPWVGAQIKLNFEKNDPLCVRSWMLHRLKYKTLITLESLLEGRRDQSILSKMIRALPIQTLKENLAVLYKNFIAVYGNEKYTSDCLSHVDLDPYDPKTERKKLDTIVQVGFSVYKIMRFYLDYEPQPDDDEATVLALEEFRDEINQILRANVDTSELAERIGPKISELTAATIIKSKKKKKSRQEDYLLRKYFKDGLLFFHRNTAHIDILREDYLFKTYFMVLPHCKMINQQLQDEFHQKINRSSVKSKISSLLEKSNDIIEVLKHEEKVQGFLQSNWISRILTFNIRWYKDVSLIVCFFQNLLIVFSNVLYYDYSSQDIAANLCSDARRTFVKYQGALFEFEHVDLSCWCSDDPSKLSTCQPAGVIIVMRNFGIVQSVASFMVFLFFFIKTAPVIWGRAQKRFKDIESHQATSVVGRCKRLWRNVFKKIYGVGCIFAEGSVLYYFLYTICAVLGFVFVTDPSTYWLSNFFVMFLMFDIVFRAPLLQHIVTAMWRPRISISLALVLFLLIEYVFSLVAYYYFSQDYRGQCNTLLTCLMVTIDNTFKANGGIGSYLQEKDGPINYQRDPAAYSMNSGRFAFDNLFNFIIVILIIQILSGIIIDTFAVLREEDEAREDDMLNYCFICGFDRQTLDKKSGNRKGFAYHVKFDHNLWNYLNYIAYIKNKEKTEYTGMESYIAEQIENGEIDWFPIHRSDTSKEGEEEDNSSKMTADMEGNVGALKTQVETLDSKIEAFYHLLSKAHPTK